MNDARTNPITMSRSAAEVYAHNYATAYAQAMAAQQAAAAKKRAAGLGAYFVFSGERFAIVKAANPGVHIKDRMAIVGVEWRALSDAQKQK